MENYYFTIKLEYENRTEKFGKEKITREREEYINFTYDSIFSIYENMENLYKIYMKEFHKLYKKSIQVETQFHGIQAVNIEFVIDTYQIGRKNILRYSAFTSCGEIKYIFYKSSENAEQMESKQFLEDWQILEQFKYLIEQNKKED